MSSRLLAILVAVALLVVCLPARAADPELVQTDHYRILGVRTDSLPRIAAYAEANFTDFSARFTTPRKPGGRMTVRVYGSGEAIAGVMGSFAVREAYDGLYVPDKKELWINGAAEDERLFEVVRHEGFHQFVDFHFGQVFPAWLEEGLATYFGYAQRTKTGLQHGWARRESATRLRTAWGTKARPALSWLLSAGYEDFHRSGDEGLNYTMSWLLVSWLIEVAPGGQAILNDYIAQLVKDPNASIVGALGDLAKVEAAMKARLDARLKPRVSTGR